MHVTTNELIIDEMCILINAYFRWIVQLWYKQETIHLPHAPPMRPRVTSMLHVKPRVGSNSSKESGKFH